jgi:hypothetical protein
LRDHPNFEGIDRIRVLSGDDEMWRRAEYEAARVCPTVFSAGFLSKEREAARRTNLKADNGNGAARAVWRTMVLDYAGSIGVLSDAQMSVLARLFPREAAAASGRDAGEMGRYPLSAEAIDDLRRACEE